MYRSLLVSLDASAWVFDNERKTVSEVWEAVNDMGSRWIFYPLPFVIRGEYGNTNFQYRKIVSAPDGLQFLQGKTIRTALQFIKDNQELVTSILS